LAAGFTLAVAVINFTIVQPTAWQLAQLRRQVAQFESQLEVLAGQRDAVADTNTLLGQLTEQGLRRAQASASLDEIADLHARLNRQTAQVERALRALERLASLQDSLLDHEGRVDAAVEVLNSMETLEDRLTGRQYDTVQSHLAVDSLDQLRSRLLDAHCQAAVADESLDAIDALEGRLVERRQNNAAAHESLDTLVALRDRLDEQGTGIEVARDRVEQLIDLKDRTLERTGDLAAATENLELMMDIQDQLGKIALSYGRMRHWITEIVAFEPTLNRAIRSLQPLAELGNLRHMNAGQLRQVIRAMNDRGTEELTATNDDTPTVPEPTVSSESAEASLEEDTAATPGVVESARAN
jgi:hypothetical protein